ncbi:hypothetical protein D3D03_14945 [Exiguobacterium sp. RIT452]|uniref:hypothetical protein n=1 Tax=Exiguobacterium sp. RIT452 TaxID=2315552 RepID=UPI000E7592EE|nr:hypothetical protein [Exiguobacterium sp. RIT452]RJO95886.1 hypothetical protein D3D03_14945 [Exiguobacterium sp. RIT452]
MNTLLEKNARLNLLGPPLKKLQHLIPVAVLMLALICWFIPGFWETGLFTSFAITVLCLGGVVREIMRLRILKRRLPAELYQETVLKVSRASMIGYFVPVLLFYAGDLFPQYSGVAFAMILIWVLVITLFVSKLNATAKQLDPAFVTMREIEQYRK